ncbi:hypothetical protein CCACVL1_19774 [Corchorus capsularis]|uniref:Transposase (putative) gypsy type domain-containing protein n=1 Tax=Corchorus capsularis TaxID=210143 RepID=A0A1R3HEY1_COCAP|nr:hypothetical protein CCACVL1_19774 [Corchorus capsularis]
MSEEDSFQDISKSSFIKVGDSGEHSSESEPESRLVRRPRNPAVRVTGNIDHPNVSSLDERHPLLRETGVLYAAIGRSVNFRKLHDERPSSGRKKFTKVASSVSKYIFIPGSNSSKSSKRRTSKKYSRSINAARLQASKAGLGPVSGYKMFLPTKADRLYMLSHNGRRAFFYKVMFECGFRILGHPFIDQVLDSYGIATSQLNPNSWFLLVGEKLLSRVLLVGIFGKPECFGVRVKDEEAWPIETQWRKVKTTEINDKHFTLTSAEEKQVEHLEKHSYKPRVLVDPARLVLCGLSPEPYKMEGIKKQKCSAGVCTPLTIFTEMERNGVIVEVDTWVRPGSQAMGHGAGKGPMALKLMQEAYEKEQADRPSPSSEAHSYDHGDYEMNPARLAAAQKRLQDELAAVAAAKSASAANVTSLTVGSTLPSIAEESNEADDLRVVASHPSLFSSGIFSGGGFGEWRELERQGQASPLFIELLGRYFAHGLSFGTLHDVAATMLGAEANFSKYEKEIRTTVLEIGDFIDKHKSGASIAQVNQLKADLLESRAKLIAAEGKLQTTELSLKDANKRAKKKDDLLKKLNRTHLKSVNKLQTKVNNLNAELDACYGATARQVLRARASAIYMIRKTKGIDDMSDTKFEDEELPDGDPLSKEFDPKPFEAPLEDPDSSDEVGAIMGKESEGGKEVTNETEGVEQRESPLKKKRKANEE